jgi:AhpD family alkylhydroperoxidase
MSTLKTILTATAVLSAAALAHAGNISPERKAVYDDIAKTFGAVPTFITQLPDAGLAGYWQVEKSLELSENSALPPKTKALISLAVAAQIPCQYCIEADTATAKHLGASDAEIGEAVSMAALTRYSSTVLNGLQADLPTFRKEMGVQ